MSAIRLTSLSHGGGCGCKIAPAALTEILAKVPHTFFDPALLVGIETSDDAAVYRLNDEQAVVATTDFFMPIVDDPYDFGRIAATNALSDIYAMGARPIFALAIVGMPLDKLPVNVIQDILAGGVEGMTDVTGFGLLGHVAEICRGSRLGARVAFESLPVLPAALSLAQQGYNTGGAARNWASYGHDVRLPDDLAPWQQALLCDPQTSGALLVTCAPQAVAAVLALFHDEGFASAAVIGQMQAGAARITVDYRLDLPRTGTDSIEAHAIS